MILIVTYFTGESYEIEVKPDDIIEIAAWKLEQKLYTKYPDIA